MPSSLAPFVASLLASSPSGPVLHIGLYRACEARIAAVRERWRDRAQHDAILAAVERLRQVQTGVHERVAKELDNRLGDPAHLLGACIAGLIALDRHHQHYQRREVAYVERTLPGTGLRARLLPSEDEPFAALIKECECAPDRGAGDFGHDPRSLLGLCWRVVWDPGQGIELGIAPLNPVVTEVLAARLPDLRLALAAPFAGLSYEFRSRPDQKNEQGTPYRFMALVEADRSRAEACLDRLLDRCRDEQVDVLCLPELALDERLHRHLTARLASRRVRHPALVIAGSMHVGEPPDCRNRAQVLDWAGDELWAHDKCACYRITAQEAASMPASVLADMGIDSDGGQEDIALGTTLELRDGPLGRMGVVICLDFLDDRQQRLLVDTGATCVFVPAMTTSTKRFQAAALTLSQRGPVASFVANSGWLVHRLDAKGQEGAAVACAQLPAKRPAWRVGMGEELHVFTIRELLMSGRTDK